LVKWLRFTTTSISKDTLGFSADNRLQALKHY
jgi:hypothetical protein